MNEVTGEFSLLLHTASGRLLLGKADCKSDILSFKTSDRSFDV